MIILFRRLSSWGPAHKRTTTHASSIYRARFDVNSAQVQGGYSISEPTKRHIYELTTEEEEGGIGPPLQLETAIINPLRLKLQVTQRSIDRGYSALSPITAAIMDIAMAASTPTPLAAAPEVLPAVMLGSYHTDDAK